MNQQQQLPRVRRHGASKPQGTSKRMLPRQVILDQLICASFPHTHYWYEVGMLKVSAVGFSPISYQIQAEYGEEQADAGRNCRNRLERPNSQARTGTGKYSFSPVQLTTSRIGNLTRSILTLAICGECLFAVHGLSERTTVQTSSLLLRLFFFYLLANPTQPDPYR